MTTNDLNGYGFAVPAVMHHYTSADGLQGILNNRALWLSDIGFLNDESEMRYALEESRKGLVATGKRAGANSDGTRGEVWMAEVVNEVSELITQQLRSPGLASPGRDDYYAASFCKSPGLLSMWRGYAASASGFSIAFDRKVLMSTFPSEPHVQGLDRRQAGALKKQNRGLLGEVAEVAYGNGDYTTALFNAAYHKVMDKAVNRDLDAVRRQGGWARDLGSEIERVSAFIKHPDFSEEHEVRLLVRSAPGAPLVPGLRNGPANLASGFHGSRR